MKWSLIQTVPNWIALATRSARPMSPVQTDAGQPEADVVRPGDRLVLVAEALDGHDRAEDLVLDDLALLVGSGDDRRLEVGAGPIRAVAADDDLGATRAASARLTIPSTLSAWAWAMSEPISMSSPSAGSPHLIVLTWPARSATKRS